LTLQQRDDDRRIHMAFVAAERGLRFDARSAAKVDAEFAGRSRTFALRLHGGIKACLVDRESAFARDIRRQIDRKTVRIVETKHGLAWNLLAFEVGDRRIEQ